MLNKRKSITPPAGNTNSVDEMPVWIPGPEERILVLAPHPDDEILAAGGVIATSQKSHPPSKLRVAIATNGDASYATAFFHGSHTFSKQHFRDMAAIRQQESLNALIFLGLNLAQIRFWGFPDRGLSPIWLRYWDTHQPYRSPTTGFDRSEQALNSPVTQYTGMSLLRLIQEELTGFQPTTIILPHPQDAHSDHRTLATLTLLAAGIHYGQHPQRSPRLLAYMMWTGNKFWLTGARSNEVTSKIVAKKPLQVKWQRLSMSLDIQTQKARALECYHSQNFSAGQLLQGGANSIQEIFCSIRPYDIVAERQS
ncbi:MAG: PIG-L family deacetylase [Anaerolineales bacterium]|nr:PIG-L family deacetylase [Anaerolineales bacterium]